MPNSQLDPLDRNTERLDQALLLFHQFGKDLAWIRSLASKLERSDPSGPGSRGASAIREVSEDMTRATRRFLLGDPERGGVTLGRVVDEAVRTVRRTGARCSFRRRIGDDCLRASVDPRLQAILTSLLENAASVSPPERPVVVKARRREDQLEIAVIDRGAGMDGPTLVRCCEDRFTTRANAGGTGTGLSASRRLAESMGWRISVESEVGSGTTVTIRIPVSST